MSAITEKSVCYDYVSSQALKALRLARNETQSRFWGRFGVTQTRGSRFELGQRIPQPVGILIRLYLDGVISDGDLWRARRRQQTTKRRVQLEIATQDAQAGVQPFPASVAVSGQLDNP